MINEQLGRANDVEMMMSSMQPPIRPTKQIVHQTSHYGIGMYLDNIPSYACKYSTLGGAIISQSAADEGSRTGIRGSGVMNVLGHNRSSQTTEPKSYYHVPRYVSLYLFCGCFFRYLLRVDIVKTSVFWCVFSANCN